jgi:hypothetical protein
MGAAPSISRWEAPLLVAVLLFHELKRHPKVALAAAAAVLTIPVAGYVFYKQIHITFGDPPTIKQQTSEQIINANRGMVATCQDAIGGKYTLTIPADLDNDKRARLQKQVTNGLCVVKPPAP